MNQRDNNYFIVHTTLNKSKKEQTMRQLTASQKIAILENRVAQLEKQAIIQMIKNLGMNWFKPLIAASEDLVSTIKGSIVRSKDNFADAAEMNLKARLSEALQRNMFFGKTPSISVEKFDAKNPVNSLIKLSFSLNGDPRVLNFTLSSVQKVREIDSKTQKDIMGAYVSWWKDWGDSLDIVINGKSPSKSMVQSVIDFFSRKFKFLGRLLSALVKFGTKIRTLTLIPTLVASLIICLCGPLGLVVGGTVALNQIGLMTLPKVVDMVLKMIEGAFRRRKVNIDKFNELIGKQASVNKYASKYPHTYSMLLRLESAGI